VFSTGEEIVKIEERSKREFRISARMRTVMIMGGWENLSVTRPACEVITGFRHDHLVTPAIRAVEELGCLRS
jgi:hypothetical protein